MEAHSKSFHPRPGGEEKVWENFLEKTINLKDKEDFTQTIGGSNTNYVATEVSL